MSNLKINGLNLGLVISDLGGLLGLFLGCSLLSIVEILYYIVSGLLSVLMRNKSINKVENTGNFLLATTLRKSEQEMPNNDILQALNQLTRTVRYINIKVDNNHREVMGKFSIVNGGKRNLERRNAQLEVIDLN